MSGGIRTVRGLDAGGEEGRDDDDRGFASGIHRRMFGGTRPAAMIQEDCTETNHGHSLTTAFSPCAIRISDMQFASIRNRPVRSADQVRVHVVVTQRRIAEITMGDCDGIGLRSDVQIAIHSVLEDTTIDRNMGRMIHSEQVISAHIHRSGSLEMQAPKGYMGAMRELHTSGGTESFFLIVKPVDEQLARFPLALLAHRGSIGKKSAVSRSREAHDLRTIQDGAQIVRQTKTRTETGIVDAQNGFAAQMLQDNSARQDEIAVSAVQDECIVRAYCREQRVRHVRSV